MYQIEDSVPIPDDGRKDGRGGHNRKYPFYELQVGHSFFVPNRAPASLSAQITHAQVKSGFRFTRRGENGGVRVWRVV